MRLAFNSQVVLVAVVVVLGADHGHVLQGEGEGDARAGAVFDAAGARYGAEADGVALE